MPESATTAGGGIRRPSFCSWLNSSFRPAAALRERHARAHGAGVRALAESPRAECSWPWIGRFRSLPARHLRAGWRDRPWESRSGQVQPAQTQPAQAQQPPVQAGLRPRSLARLQESARARVQVSAPAPVRRILPPQSVQSLPRAQSLKRARAEFRSQASQPQAAHRGAPSPRHLPWRPVLRSPLTPPAGPGPHQFLP